MIGSMAARTFVLGCCMVFPASMVFAQAAPAFGCYERVYDARHLAEHKGQSVRRIIGTLVKSEGEETPGTAATLHLDVWFKGDQRKYDAGGGCAPQSSGLRCGMDGDAGSLNLSAAAKGMRLEIPSSISVETEGEDEAVYKKVTGPEHRVFLMQPVPAARCGTN